MHQGKYRINDNLSMLFTKTRWLGKSLEKVSLNRHLLLTSFSKLLCHWSSSIWAQTTWYLLLETELFFLFLVGCSLYTKPFTCQSLILTGINAFEMNWDQDSSINTRQPSLYNRSNTTKHFSNSLLQLLDSNRYERRISLKKTIRLCFIGSVNSHNWKSWCKCTPNRHLRPPPSKNRPFRKKHQNRVFILERCSKVSSFRISLTF